MATPLQALSSIINMTRSSTRRLLYEMNEFQKHIYASEFNQIRHINDNTVAIVTYDGTTYTITRSLDFFQPPIVYSSNPTKQAMIDNCQIEWAPVLSSAKWLLMIHCLCKD